MFPGRRCVFDLPIPGKGVIYGVIYLSDKLLITAMDLPN